MKKVLTRIILLFFVNISYSYSKEIWTHESEYQIPKGKGLVLASIYKKVNNKRSSDWNIYLNYRKRDNSKLYAGRFKEHLAGDASIKDNSNLEEFYYEDSMDWDEDIKYIVVPGLNLSELDTGKYEIYSWTILVNCGGPAGCFEIKPKKEFSILFNVEEGSTNYIGEIEINIEDGGFWITKHIKNVEFKINDRNQRDIELAKLFEAKIVNNISVNLAIEN